MIEQPTPEMTQLIVHDLAMERDRNRWRSALTDLTPGGSEFAGDPEYCKKFVQDRRDALWETAKKNYLGYFRLREALEDAIKALRLVRNGAEGKEIQTLARDVVNKLEALNVGKGQQAPTGPGPSESPSNIARKEPD